MKNRTYLIAGILAVIEAIIISWLGISQKSPDESLIKPGLFIVFGLFILGIYYLTISYKSKKENKLTTYSAILQIIAGIIIILGFLINIYIYYIQKAGDFANLAVFTLFIFASVILSGISIILLVLGIIKRRLEK